MEIREADTQPHDTQKTHQLPEGYTRERCSECGSRVRSMGRYTISRKPEVYCSPFCRDSAFFGECSLARAAKRRTCIHCQKPKPASDSPYCVNCQKLAYPASMSTRENRCAVCGGQIPEFRKSRTQTCSSRCADTLKKREQRNTASERESDSQIPPLQFAHSTTLKAGHFSSLNPQYLLARKTPMAIL